MKILWDIDIIPARRLDIILIKKKQKEAVIVDIVIPADKRISEKEHEKIEKYQDFWTYGNQKGFKWYQ